MKDEIITKQYIARQTNFRNCISNWIIDSFYGKIKDKTGSTYDVNRGRYHILLNNTSKGYWLRVETDNLVISVARGWEILDSFKFSSFDRLTETVYELLKCSEYKDTILVLNNSITLDTLDKLD